MKRICFVALLGWLLRVEVADAAPRDSLPGDIVETSTLEAYLDRVRERCDFHGAVLIALGDRMLIRRAYGLASDAPAVPATPETVFDLGSISKQFTATAILKLVDHGLLSLSDPVRQFFPEAPPDKAAITLHQLLTHTSGLTEHSSNDLGPLTRTEALDRIFRSPLAFEPGRQYRYSNSGYTLAAANVEVATGQPFTQYLPQSLFDPVGMVHTGFYGEARWRELSVAHGFFNGSDSGSPATWPGPYWGQWATGKCCRRWTTFMHGSPR